MADSKAGGPGTLNYIAFLLIAVVLLFLAMEGGAALYLNFKQSGEKGRVEVIIGAVLFGQKQTGIVNQVG